MMYGLESFTYTSVKPCDKPHRKKGVEEQWEGSQGLNKTLTTLCNK